MFPYQDSLKDWIESENIWINNLCNGRNPTYKEIQYPLMETGLECEWSFSMNGIPEAHIDRSDGSPSKTQE